MAKSDKEINKLIAEAESHKIKELKKDNLRLLKQLEKVESDFTATPPTLNRPPCCRDAVKSMIQTNRDHFFYMGVHPNSEANGARFTSPKKFYIKILILEFIIIWVVHYKMSFNHI